MVAPAPLERHLGTLAVPPQVFGFFFFYLSSNPLLFFPSTRLLTRLLPYDHLILKKACKSDLIGSKGHIRLYWAALGDIEGHWATLGPKVGLA